METILIYLSCMWPTRRLQDISIMKKTILILVCILVLIQGIVAIIKWTNPGLLNISDESTAYNIGKILGIFFKIALGATGLIILFKKSDKKISF
ncbi:MAG: hypothetical protein M3Z26_03555 [Bacteroidota bacterium]|nr:hypothetical protein [Bacteroidota bacterium]